MKSRISLLRKGSRLYIRYYYNQSRAIFGTNIFVDAEHWDKQNKALLPSLPDYEQAIFVTDQEIQKIRKIVLDLETQGEKPLASKVKDKYSGKVNAVDFWAFFEMFLKEAKNSKRKNTVTNYLKLKRILKDFEVNQRCKIDWSEIDLSFYSKLHEYFVNSVWQDNYFGANIKLLKAVLNDATERGYNENLRYKSRKFKVLSNPTDSVALTDEELTKLFELDLSQKRVLRNCRDAFLIGSYTGLRYSDLRNLGKDQINGKAIQIRQTKTGNKVTVPIHPIVKEILIRNNGVPKVVDLSDFNKQIKRVAAKAGLNEKVEVCKTVGGKLSRVKMPKHELVKSHTMRRSFATNLHRKGVPARIIMIVTGHKSLKSFEKYLNISPDEAIKSLESLWNTNH